MQKSKEYTLFGTLVNDKDEQTLRFSAGPIGDYKAGIYPAIDINKLIRAETLRNQVLKTLVIDITSASYQHLQLAPDVQQILKMKIISLIFWESCQKFGLLHTDQAQYGRVFAYCHKTSASSAYIHSLKDKAAYDIHLPDVQNGAFIGKNSSAVLQHIKVIHKVTYVPDNTSRVYSIFKCQNPKLKNATKF